MKILHKAHKSRTKLRRKLTMRCKLCGFCVLLGLTVAVNLIFGVHLRFTAAHFDLTFGFRQLQAEPTYSDPYT